MKPVRSVRSVRIARILAPAIAAACLLASGCAQRVYGPPGPPPPPVPNILDIADHNGYRAGFDDGVRDAVHGFGYQPRHDRRYADTPGYDPDMGPYRPYRNAFRSAYLRGYYDGFHRR